MSTGPPVDRAGGQGGALVHVPDPTLPEPALERAIVARLKSGDRSAAAQLFAWFGDRLYRQIILPRLPVRELAEDVLKDTFRLALERIAQYEPQDRSIFFWLRRIAINRAIDVHRARQRQNHLEEVAEPDRFMAAAPPEPDQPSDQHELRGQIEISLSRMNARYAEALRLRLLEDLDREECARRLNVTVGNFDVILHRACKAFREVYPP